MVMLDMSDYRLPILKVVLCLVAITIVGLILVLLGAIVLANIVNAVSKLISYLSHRKP